MPKIIPEELKGDAMTGADERGTRQREDTKREKERRRRKRRRWEGVGSVGERGAATSTTVAGGLGDCSCAMRRPCTSSAAEVGFADSGHVGVGPPLDARDARDARTARTAPPPSTVAKQLLRQTQATVTPPRLPHYPTARRHPPPAQ